MASEHVFPQPHLDSNGIELKSYSPSGGLTKRELFAAMAMQGLLAHWQPTSLAYDINKKASISAAAVVMADTLLAALASGGAKEKAEC